MELNLDRDRFTAGKGSLLLSFGILHLHLSNDHPFITITLFILCFFRLRRNKFIHVLICHLFTHFIHVVLVFRMYVTRCTAQLDLSVLQPDRPVTDLLDLS